MVSPWTTGLRGFISKGLLKNSLLSLEKIRQVVFAWALMAS